MDHENARLARRLWVAVSRADLDSLEELIAEDVAWHTLGRSRWAGVRRGRAAVLDFLGRIGGSAEIFNSDLIDILASDTRAMTLFRVSGKRGERILDLDFLLLLRFEARRVAEVWAIPTDQYAVDRFWEGD